MTISMRRLCAPLLLLCACLSARAQNAVRIEPAQGSLLGLTRPYRVRDVQPINLANSSRIESHMRAGNLYLSATDMVALATENNIDVKIQRNAPLLAKEVLLAANA